MAMYTFREIPDEIWRKVHERVKQDGISMRQLGPRLLALYARCGLKRLEDAADAATGDGTKD